MNAAFGPFFVILFGILLGFLLRRTKHLPEGASRFLNAYVISIAAPALVLAKLPSFLVALRQRPEPIEPILYFLPLVPWSIFLGAFLFFTLFYRWGWIRRDQWGLLVLAGGLGNTAFVGFPLLEALVGPQSIPPAILLDQLGTFLAVSLGGSAWVAYHKSGGRFDVRRITQDLIRFPPFIAMGISFLSVFLFPVDESLRKLFERFGDTLVPVAMVSVGAQLSLKSRHLLAEWKGLVSGLGYKMVLAPLVVWAFARLVLEAEGDLLRVAVLEAGMAPMITATVMGIEAGFAAELGALLLGIGIPVSLLTVSILNLALTSSH